LLPIYLLEQNKIGNQKKHRANNINERHHSRHPSVDFVAEQMKNNRRPESEENEDDEGIETDDDQGHSFLVYCDGLWRLTLRIAS